MIKKVREMIALIEADGWVLELGRGTSHKQFNILPNQAR